MKRQIKFLCIISTMIIASFMLGCDNGKDDPVIPGITSFTYSPTSLKLLAGTSTEFVITIAPAEAVSGLTAADIKITSGSPEVLTIGKITISGAKITIPVNALKAGKSTVTTTVKTKTSTFEVEVTADGVRKVSFAEDTIKLKTRDTYTLKPILEKLGNPKDTAVFFVKTTVVEGDESFIYLDDDGTIKAQLEGKGYVRAVLKSNINIYDSVLVIVSLKGADEIKITEISLFESYTFDIKKPEGDGVGVALEPRGANEELKWKILNTDIATLSGTDNKSRTITPKKIGETKLVVSTLDDRVSDTADIIVRDYVALEKFELISPKLNAEGKLDIHLFDTVILAFKITPENASNKKLEFGSSGFTTIYINSKRAEFIRYNGSDTVRVIAKYREVGGENKIFVISNDNYKASLEIDMNILDQKANVSKVEITKTADTLYIYKGERQENVVELSATVEVTPDNASNKELIWTSTNTDVASVATATADKCKVSINGAGVAYFVATSKHDSKMKDSIKIVSYPDVVAYNGTQGVITNKFYRNAYLGGAVMSKAATTNDYLQPNTTPAITIKNLRPGTYNWKLGSVTGSGTVTAGASTFGDLTIIAIPNATRPADNDFLTLTIDGEELIIASFHPYQIRHYADIVAMKDDLAGDYILLSDVTFPEDHDYTPIGTSATPFTGAFSGANGSDGSVYTVTFQKKITSTTYVGMFGYVNNPGKAITFVHIKHSGIEGTQWVGGLAGYAAGGTISNVFVSPLIAANHKIEIKSTTPPGDANIGGIVGESKVGLTYVINTTSIDGKSGNNVGGLVGLLDGNVGINYSFVASKKGTTPGSISGVDAVGGLVGNVSNTGEGSSCAYTGYVYNYGISSGGGAGGFIGGDVPKLVSVLGYYDGGLIVGQAGGFCGGTLTTAANFPSSVAFYWSKTTTLEFTSTGNPLTPSASIVAQEYVSSSLSYSNGKFVYNDGVADRDIFNSLSFTSFFDNPTDKAFRPVFNSIIANETSTKAFYNIQLDIMGH